MIWIAAKVFWTFEATKEKVGDAATAAFTIFMVVYDVEKLYEAALSPPKLRLTLNDITLKDGLEQKETHLWVLLRLN